MNGREKGEVAGWIEWLKHEKAMGFDNDWEEEDYKICDAILAYLESRNG